MQAIAVATLLVIAPLAQAAASAEGRWDGAIHIPGRELAVTVDLARSADSGWRGSLIMPGMALKGAPLSNIAIGASDVAFDTGRSFAGSGDEAPAKFTGRFNGRNAITGDFTQGGHVAKFALRRVGVAQVESAPQSTPVRDELAHGWTGEYELGGYPRHVTIAFENRAHGGATAKFVIVGKQTTDLPVDLVVDEGDFVTIESRANRVAFEGRFVKQTGEIKGTISFGALELPLVLHRSVDKAP